MTLRMRFCAWIVWLRVVVNTVFVISVICIWNNTMSNMTAAGKRPGCRSTVSPAPWCEDVTASSICRKLCREQLNCAWRGLSAHGIGACMWYRSHILIYKQCRLYRRARAYVCVCVQITSQRSPYMLFYRRIWAAPCRWNNKGERIEYLRGHQKALPYAFYLTGPQCFCLFVC